MRPQVRAGVLNSACFPLVPLSNRIARSTFYWRGRKIVRQPNHPTKKHEPVLHGFGWLRPWDVVDVTESRATIQVSAHPEGWPWPWRCKQTIELRPTGLTMELSLTHEGNEAMPAGLGFHPFFPLDRATRYHGLHRGEWIVGADSLPLTLRTANKATDWWAGERVTTRPVDTVYAEREGPLTIDWPERHIGIVIRPSATLSFTTVYVPPNADFFCVEPVSHATDAFNRSDEDGLKALAPGDTLTASMDISAVSRGIHYEQFRKTVDART